MTFNRRYATHNNMGHFENRGLKPTATIALSLRDGNQRQSKPIEFDKFIDTDIVNVQRSAAKAAVPAGFAGSLAADRFISNVGRYRGHATRQTAKDEQGGKRRDGVSTLTRFLFLRLGKGGIMGTLTGDARLATVSHVSAAACPRRLQA